MRYHGSTIVLADEACFCEFEAPSIADVAEANRRAAFPSTESSTSWPLRPTCERRSPMNASTTIPSDRRDQRSRPPRLIVAVAALAASITWNLWRSP